MRGSVQRLRFATDVQSDGRGLHRKREVDRSRLIHQQLGDGRLRSKAIAGSGDGIRAGRELQELIAAGTVRSALRVKSLGFVIEADQRTGNCGAARVCYRAAQRG
jgi:hypothetical protein